MLVSVEGTSALGMAQAHRGSGHTPGEMAVCERGVQERDTESWESCLAVLSGVWWHPITGSKHQPHSLLPPEEPLPTSECGVCSVHAKQCPLTFNSGAARNRIPAPAAFSTLPFP